ncbi:hypothetical protein HUG12_04665 [Halorarum salinum]|uniref:Uncharacterized protein n=2 Tax=Halorarum salinum TaxID=2743089 RepID=A0A7D5LCY6_9EURY|nr:hypothetical protein HUG12_04665 [Halobaculum salinum]
MHLLVVSVVVIGLTTIIVPVQSTSSEHPLDENETATLWSNDPDTCPEGIQTGDGVGSETAAIRELANCTDLTFKRPPSTAARWSVHDFEELEPGDGNTSVHPPNATLTDSVVIADAHASLFAAHPSTTVHREPDDSPLYIAPTGTVRGLVDYRVRPLENESVDVDPDSGASLRHEVSEVRLLLGGDVLTVTNGSQTPVLAYETNETGRTNLTIEADIRVRLAQGSPATGGTDSDSETTVDEVTVSESIPVRVYGPTVEQFTARYPNGDTGIALYQRQPWHGYSLRGDGDARVRGVWRYYTARDTGWDELVHSRSDGSERVRSDARPVFVHAYPSEIGPRAEPVRDGPTILDVWGTESESPAIELPENVTVDVVEQPYTQSYGLALRTDERTLEGVHVQGIVRGVNTTVTIPDDERVRPLRESELSVELENQSASGATLRIELTDATTGDPISLTDTQGADPVAVPADGERRTGYITVNGERVETNPDGTATVQVREPGSYSVRYHPGSWLSHDPAYVGSTASVSWHPLLTVAGWVAFLDEVVWWSIPFVTALYGGIRIGKFLKYDEYQYK